MGGRWSGSVGGGGSVGWRRLRISCRPALALHLPPLLLPHPHTQERPQYLHHFVLHAALDAVEEQEWRTTAMHLGVVDRFNNLQARRAGNGGGGVHGAASPPMQ